MTFFTRFISHLFLYNHFILRPMGERNSIAKTDGAMVAWAET